MLIRRTLGGSIGGTVTDAATGAPLYGIRVDVYNTNGTLVKSATSASNGVFTAAGLLQEFAAHAPDVLAAVRQAVAARRQDLDFIRLGVGRSRQQHHRHKQRSHPSHRRIPSKRP